VVIQLTDDEKFLWNDEILDTYKSYGLANLRDIGLPTRESHLAGEVAISI
jgi:hypothetical protein